ncbi:hypothetical protein KP509_23G032300 [Ceratopteris richardii]|uniref:Uncharacterized protein n=1 Tax=Ceratopteris richardii TaxID=49495 RepID=A0A8T2S0W2_CERRI|nr:hypothetical protein KP509_23G032300 [Ceratopteris richardii]
MLNSRPRTASWYRKWEFWSNEQASSKSYLKSVPKFMNDGSAICPGRNLYFDSGYYWGKFSSSCLLGMLELAGSPLGVALCISGISHQFYLILLLLCGCCSKVVKTGLLS